MKKIICVLICLGIILGLFKSEFIIKGVTNFDSGLQESIESKLIRFHVIANSDTAADQALKLKVRDKVLAYISPKLKESNSIEESRKILLANDDKIKKIAQEVIKSNGYKYSIETTLSKHKFPVKTYGNITLPQGEYEAYRIIIGNGSGQNWWCVMFPPLCFIDISKGETSYEETEKTMKQVLSEKEYESVDNTSTDFDDQTKEEENDDEKVVIKFKIVEIFHNIFK